MSSRKRSEVQGVSEVPEVRQYVPEIWAKKIESQIAIAAQRLSDAVDQEVMDKLLKEASTPMATTTGPYGTLDVKKIKRVLLDMTDERITIDLYQSSKTYEAQVRVFFPDFSYGHELGIDVGARVDVLMDAFDGALVGLQDHIERKEMEAWL